MGRSFIGDPGRYVKKVSGCGHLSPWGPPSSRGEPGMCRKGGHVLGTFMDEWRRALVVRHVCARDSVMGTSERWGFWEICKMLLGLSLDRGSVGVPGVGSFPGTLERKVKYIWVPFLDPRAIKTLSLGATWNFSKGTALSWVYIRLWGTKGPSVRSRWIGTVRARTHC